MPGLTRMPSGVIFDLLTCHWRAEEPVSVRRGETQDGLPPRGFRFPDTQKPDCGHTDATGIQPIPSADGCLKTIGYAGRELFNDWS